MFREFCTQTMQFPLALSLSLSLSGKVCAFGHCLDDVFPWKSISNVNIRLSETATKATVAVAFQHETFIRRVCLECERLKMEFMQRYRQWDEIAPSRSIRCRHRRLQNVHLNCIVNNKQATCLYFIAYEIQIHCMVTSKTRMHRVRRLYALHAM